MSEEKAVKLFWVIITTLIVVAIFSAILFALGLMPAGLNPMTWLWVIAAYILTVFVMMVLGIFVGAGKSALRKIR